MAEGDRPSRKAKAELAGRKIGDFHLLRSLGAGAMAEVYLAEQESLQRQVALKVLRPELASDETYVRRFHREAQAAARLVHANIVQIYEVGSFDNTYYIAEEYVPGMNLRQWLQRNGPPNAKTALIIMRQVAAALVKASEEGIVHRDVKPENILLNHTLAVKVADFGLARVRPTGEGVELTRVGMTMGTPLYMSPEQVEGKPLDSRSDIYSFGVTCYHLLAGEPPFSGETPLAVAVQHLKKRPEPLESLRPDLPAALCRVVHRMLEKDPAHRFPSAVDLLRELRRIYLEEFGDDWPESLPDVETTELTTAARTQAVEQLGRLMKASGASRRRMVLATSIVLAAIASFSIGAAVAYWGRSEPPLLASADAPRLAVQRFDSSVRQILHARFVGTEEAWKAVIEYFPDQTDDVALAKSQLVLIYLSQDRLEEALKLCDELAAESDAESEMRAFGLAGRCGILTLQGRYQESAETLNELWPIRSYLRNPFMRQLLAYAVTTNRERLGLVSARGWSNWLEEQNVKLQGTEAIPSPSGLDNP
ncbi:MAG: serine/threonine protein kinase [Planctomycetota bacterium]|nr:MAG: serine/threonine protein kinase [Planctomycetota bacterium]